MCRPGDTVTKNIRVAILGASGFGAGELLRLFVQHPHVEVMAVTSTSQVGEPMERVHPHLRGFYPELRVTESIDFERLLESEQAVVVSALPHGVSGPTLDALLSKMANAKAGAQLRLIDLSGDLRLKTHAIHENHYRESPLLPERRREFVYGLPELQRDAIRTAHAIANPGCLATAAILALAPLVRDDFRGQVVVDAKTGSSGSGRSLSEKTHHPTRHADFRAYKPLAHQHEPEILQAWNDPGGDRISLSFVAQSMDVVRGIFVTAHVTLPHETSLSALLDRYATFYHGSRFVRFVQESPNLQDVVGSNFCDIGLAARGRQVIVMTAIDNLIKGMAGTAIQNMNLMCGIPDETGLWTPALRLV